MKKEINITSPKTQPQVDDKTYAKWLTDKYNTDTSELKAKIIDLEIKLKNASSDNKVLRSAVKDYRLKYMNDKKEFSKELMKDGELLKLKREIQNLHKAVNRLRNDNKQLIEQLNKK